MAQVYDMSSIKEHAFYTISPGREPEIDILVPRSKGDEKGVWNKTSGELKIIDGLLCVLYRHAGTMYIRVGKQEFPIDESAVAQLDTSDPDYLTLEVEMGPNKVAVKELFPPLLRCDPCLDEMQMESYLWTYCTYHVISKPGELKQHWGFSGW